jgi:translation elongation factor EF-1alpha
MNKMDRIGWNPERFATIKNKLEGYLIKIGFQVETIIYVPISAIQAVNIIPKNTRKF